jgi:hypothetical protein
LHHSLRASYRGCICIVAQTEVAQTEVAQNEVAQNEVAQNETGLSALTGFAALSALTAMCLGSIVVVGRNTVILELVEFIRGECLLYCYIF